MTKMKIRTVEAAVKNESHQFMVKRITLGL